MDMAGVPATGGDATDYDASMSDSLGKSALFNQKYRALPGTLEVYGSLVSVTTSELSSRGLDRAPLYRCGSQGRASRKFVS